MAEKIGTISESFLRSIFDIGLTIILINPATKWTLKPNTVNKGFYLFCAFSQPHKKLRLGSFYGQLRII